jgi:anti-sigma-K factor RskA
MSDEQMPPNHDYSADAAAYVLGSLSPEEAQAFRAHMEGCVACRDEVQALRQVADALPIAAPQYSVPRGLRRRVLRQIHSEARAAARGRAPRPNRFLSAFPRPALVGGVAVVAALAIVGGIELASSGSGGTAVFRSSVGQAEVRVTDNHGVLVVKKLPHPSGGHIYEVWLQRGSAPPVPARALFGVTPKGSAVVKVPGNMSGVSAVLVTQEPDGGTLHPTGPAVIVTPVDAS